MEAILVIAVVALLVVVGYVLFDRGPVRRRRTVIVDRAPRRHVVEEEVPVTRRRIVEE